MYGGRSPDAVVVGAGAIGSSIAFELAGLGMSVLVLERSTSLVGGCSSGNAGLIVPSHSLPLANGRALTHGLLSLVRRDCSFVIDPRPQLVPWLLRFALAALPARVDHGRRLLQTLASESLELHEQLSERLRTSFARKGVLNVYETTRSYARAVRELGRQSYAGAEAKPVTGDEACRLVPALSSQPAGATFFPHEAHCDPSRFVEALAEGASERGARFVLSTPVERLRCSGGRVVEVGTSSETFKPGHTILAAGAWTSDLIRPLGLQLPIVAGKGFHVDLASAEPFGEIPVFLQEAHVVLTPLVDRLRVSGAMRLTGLDDTNGLKYCDALLQAASRPVSTLAHARVLGRWSGLRPCTADGLPVIGRPQSLDNLIIAAGHGQLGITLAPVTARIVRELVAGSMRGEMEAFAPDRFRTILRGGGKRTHRHASFSPPDIIRRDACERDALNPL